jgi:chromosome segregation ATPase
MNKLEQFEEKKKTFEDLLKSIEKDETKIKKTYEEKMGDIITKKKAFEEQLKAIEKDEAKTQKAFDEKMVDIISRKKTFEETLRAVEKDEAKVKKSIASSSDKKAAKDESDLEKEKKKKVFVLFRLLTIKNVLLILYKFLQDHLFKSM